MTSIVNTNIQALNSQRALASSQDGLKAAMERLSSGLRINSAKDDAAGLAIAERFKAQSGGIDVAMRNAQDGISFMQTAEGALAEVGDMLLRMRDLAVQASNGTLNSNDRTNLNTEFKALAGEIQRTFKATEFNGANLFSAKSKEYTFQIGADNHASNRIKASVTQLQGQNSFKSVADAKLEGKGTSSAQKAIGAIDRAIDEVTTQRGKFGAIMNRFDYTINNLANTRENIEAARSRITDADFARESANLSRQQVLQQASTAMLAQANQSPQQALGLLR